MDVQSWRSTCLRGQYQARKEALDRDHAVYSEKFETTSQLADEFKDQYTTQKAEFDRVQSRITEVDEELTVKRREMLTVSQGHTHLEAKLGSLDEKIQTQTDTLEEQRLILNELSEQKSEYESRRNRLHKELEGERQMQLSIMQDVENFEENVRQLRASKETKEQEVSTFKDQLNEVTSLLYGLENMQNNFEGFQEGVKNIMLWQRQRMEQRADGQVETVLKVNDIYGQTIARKMSHEKISMVQKKKKMGIQTIYTAPSDLSMKTVNKYLELKGKGLI